MRYSSTFQTVLGRPLFLVLLLCVQEGDNDVKSKSTPARRSNASKSNTMSPSNQEGDDDDDDDDEEMGPSDTATPMAKSSDGSASANSATPRAALDAMLATEREINPQVNRSLKKARKADKKKLRRQAAKSATSSPGGGGGDAYDFSRDFYAGGGAARTGSGAEADLSDDDDL